MALGGTIGDARPTSGTPPSWPTSRLQLLWVREGEQETCLGLSLLLLTQPRVTVDPLTVAVIIPSGQTHCSNPSHLTQKLPRQPYGSCLPFTFMFSSG